MNKNSETTTETAILTFENLILDTQRHTLNNNGVVHELRPKEFALLKLFMLNPNTIISRAQIMKNVWNTEYLGDTRTLYTHICWLRQKIEEDPHHPQYLFTVRGVGYRFGSPV